MRLAAAGDLHCAGPEESSGVLASLAAVAADVYNVSMPVIGNQFSVFELSA